ncbi:hypothetical protein PG991_002737 [Apiospora marii]|uniref:Protein kinase domain-containing protein n=1 Tax=Apiospora marii TaxID=335849 RepID=A0ABR1SGD9_9PEZI
MGTRFIENVNLYFANGGRYECEGTLGQGAYGCVFKIKDNQAAGCRGKRFALKVPFTQQVSSGEEGWLSETAVLNVSHFQRPDYLIPWWTFS